MCSRYNSETVDFIIPTQIIFSTLCESYDKTNLFLVGIIRIFLFMTIYTYIFSYDISPTSYFKYFKFIFMGYISINVFVLLYVMSKKQKYKKDDNSNQNVLSDTNNLHT